MANFTNRPKNVSTLTNRSFDDEGMTWNDADFSWDSAESQIRTWDSKRGTFFKPRTKNTSNYTNRTKN